MVSFPKTNSSPFALGTQVMVMMVMMMMVMMVVNKLFPICPRHTGDCECSNHRDDGGDGDGDDGDDCADGDE